MSEKKLVQRSVEVLVLSDIHLGTTGCHAKELLKYLKSIEPKKVVLNGDIIDIWQFKKKYWPKSHMKVVKYIMGWVSKGIEVIYITGNHDEMLRKLVGFQMGGLSIKNKIVLELDGKKAWFFHGDVFDVTMQHSKWLVKLGAVGYDILIHLNRQVNLIRSLFRLEKVSFSKRIKNKVKGAVKFINNFEILVSDLAIENEYSYVICGHIHQPIIKEYSKNNKSTMYLNSGDWIENLSALEYHNSKWSLYRYDQDARIKHNFKEIVEVDSIDQSTKEVFQNLLNDFNISSK
ncbi:UDP-2,3-diacylglucosamine diphosphatase [Bacteroidota bacterium]